MTFFLAMMPFGELRISLPIALSVYHLDWAVSYFLSVTGNLFIVLILLLFLEPVSEWLAKNFNFFQKFFSWLFQRTRKKYKREIERYGGVTLTLLVALPLPVTGGWTGALLAFLFGIPFRKAFFLIMSGILIAGGIVTGATLFGLTLEEYFGWETLFGLLITIGFCWLIYKIYRRRLKILFKVSGKR